MTTLPSRPRILGVNAARYIGKQVSIIGEVTQVTPAANTVNLTMPDNESMLIFLPKDRPARVDLHLLTEIEGNLVSRGQVDATWIKQWSQRATVAFNKGAYVDAALVYDSQRHCYDP